MNKQIKSKIDVTKIPGKKTKTKQTFQLWPQKFIYQYKSETQLIQQKRLWDRIRHTPLMSGNYIFLFLDINDLQKMLRVCDWVQLTFSARDVSLCLERACYDLTVSSAK